MKTANVLRILAVLVLVGVLLGCSSTPVPPKVYAVGEKASQAGLDITLNSYKLGADQILTMNFTVANTSTKEVNLSTRLTMEGRNAAGTKLIFGMCPANELGGKIASGGTITGDICLAAVTTLDGVTLVFDPTAQQAYTISWAPR